MSNINIGSRRTTKILAVFFLLLTGYTVWSIVDLQDDLKAAEHRASVNASRQDKAEAAAASLADQVEDLGGRPVIDPEDLEKALENRPGVAPSAADVSFAVQLYCADGRCNGKEPTSSQVAAAVSQYCNLRGECRGPDGKDGRDAPPPTAQAIFEAVTEYCSTRNDCRGTDGADGKNGNDGKDGKDGVDGTNGADGRGITNVTCENGQFIVYFSDGTNSGGIGDCEANGGPPVVDQKKG